MLPMLDQCPYVYGNALECITDWDKKQKQRQCIKKSYKKYIISEYE